MDPESEMEARQAFAEKGMVVVGWYHSHPTFVTYPSIRDIENQAAYQELFRETLGTGFVEPFVGVIVNPYPSVEETERMVSRVSYIGVSMEWSPDHEHSMTALC
jgi:protein MYSM1